MVLPKTWFKGLLIATLTVAGTGFQGAGILNKTIPWGGLITQAQQYSGMASWYGPKFHGRRTASGEIFNQHGLTAAHRSLPFGTQVRVTNRRNGRSVVVRINDRGPRKQSRIIDLSSAAANAIGLKQAGVAPVTVEIL